MPMTKIKPNSKQILVTSCEKTYVSTQTGTMGVRAHLQRLVLILLCGFLIKGVSVPFFKLIDHLLLLVVNGLLGEPGLLHELLKLAVRVTVLLFEIL